MCFVVSDECYLPEPPPVTTTILPAKGKSPTTMFTVDSQLQGGARLLYLRAEGSWRM